MEVFPLQPRRGRVTSPVVNVAAGQSALTVTCALDLAGLNGRGPHGIAFTAWRKDAGRDPIGLWGARLIFRVVVGQLDHLTTGGWRLMVDKNGLPMTRLMWSWAEECRRDDLCDPGLPTVHDYQIEGRTFRQYAVSPEVWLEVDQFASDDTGARVADASFASRWVVTTDARRVDPVGAR